MEKEYQYKTKEFQYLSKNKYLIISTIQFIISILIFVFWIIILPLLSLLTGDKIYGSMIDNLRFFIILPTFVFIFLTNVLLFIISVIITINIFIKCKEKKIRIKSVISTLLVSTILWIFPIYYFKENIYMKYLKSTNSCKKTIKYCKNLEPCGILFNCYHNLALKRKDVNICNYIIDNTRRDWCIEAAAKNSEECKLIVDEFNKNECLLKFKN